MNSSFLAILKIQSALLLLDPESSALKNSSISFLGREGLKKKKKKDILSEFTAPGRLFMHSKGKDIFY
jgi:hypothetical protein